MRTSSRERGTVLVEFIVVSFVFMMILFMGLGLGIALDHKDIMSEGLRIAVRDAATKPGALADSSIGTAAIYRDFDVFREDMTAIDITGLSRAQVDAIFNGPWQSPLDATPQPVPACHRVLKSCMMVETRNLGAGNRILMRFPGVLLRNGNSLIVRVPEANGGTTDLWRIVTPPDNSAPAMVLTNQGLVRMEGNYWHKFSIWMLGGPATTLPAAYTAAFVPAGYAVIDNGLGVRRAQRLRALAVSREEVQ